MTTIKTWAGLALVAASFACGSADDGVTEEALASGDALPAYGMNYGGLAPNDYHPEGLAAKHMGLERAWWSLTADVKTYDAQVLRAAQANVSIAPVVFAAYTGGYTPANRAEWKQFVAALATRFGPKNGPATGTFWRENPTVSYRPVRTWEIWNEENTPSFWYGPPSATNYHDALLAARLALRSVDPSSRVIFGGLIDFSNDAHNALDFLTQVTNEPHGRCIYDAVAVHPYSDTVETAIDRVEQTRAKLDKLGLADVDIWVTEVGWAVGGNWQKNAQGVVETTPFTVADGQHQADHIEAFADAMDNHRTDWHIGPTIWFNYQDLSGDVPGQKEWDFHCGMMALDSHGSPTIARPAFKTAAALANKTQHVDLPKLRCTNVPLSQ